MREAIEAANTNVNFADCTRVWSRADIVNVPAGTYTLTGASGDDANLSGDLDILKSLTITRAGAGSTIINTNSVDRVFHITGAYTVALNSMTIQNGSVNNEGGTFGGEIRSTGTAVTIQNGSVISNNTAARYGGGVDIHNNGNLTVTDSTMSFNITTNVGS